MNFEIIDFHTHPFETPDENICKHLDNCGMSPEHTVELMKAIGVTRICGSVISNTKPNRTMPESWEIIKNLNDTALRLRDRFNGFYIPGFHVHPAFVEESCQEIERMEAMGIRLIGELVPYWHGWSDYSCDGFDKIIDCATAHNMIISYHSMDYDQMDAMVEKHPDTVFVAAHPGEYGDFVRHMERMKLSRNLYLDLSGYGIHRYGMLKHAVDEYGAERFIFGSDYPTCAPAMYAGGVVFDDQLTDEQKKLILSDNAKRLLNI